MTNKAEIRKAAQQGGLTILALQLQWPYHEPGSDGSQCPAG